MPEGIEYWMVTTTDDKGNKTLTGGMMKRQNARQHGITNFIDVKSIDEYSSRLEYLEGKIVMPKMPVPGMGYFATCLDIENNNFVIWETDSKAK
jgi:predicted enzyme related to lactoylglutathione lyase